MTNNKLKPCPFCGNPHVLLRNVEYDKTLWIIECRICRSEFTVKRWNALRKQDNRSRVVEEWNRRANEQYEDMEEQGLLVRLPCKVGDMVYRVIDDCKFPFPVDCGNMCKGCEYRNLFIEEDTFHLNLLTDSGKLRRGYYTTHEEAEKALEEV